MFEDKDNIESDILMRSILSQAQEEVPEHVWEGISTGLDKIDAAKNRKPVVLWFRRSAIAVAAAAAVAIGLVLNHGGNDELVPKSISEDMIAVAEPVKEPAEESAYIADAGDIVRKQTPSAGIPVQMTSEDDQTESVIPKAEEQEALTVTGQEMPGVTSEDERVPATETVGPEEPKEYFPDVWPEDEERKVRKTRTSLVLSGTAGTNSAQNNGAGGPFRRPSISTAPVTTGIRQTSTESTYGLPVSFGAGVKVGLSPRWAIGVGLDYTLLTRKFYGTYTHVSNGLEDKKVSSDIRNSQHYIGIPVNAYYSILENNYVNFYAYAGGAIEKCVSDRYDLLSTTIVHRERPKGVQVSANVGIGVEFALGRYLGMYLDPSVRYYFDCNQPTSIRTAQPLMLGFEIGLRVNL
ncbi:MAG: PorT family protein [Bacteroidales bacterium]|nr:PorT family protein [Bacteroidales bacterium]